MVTGISVDVEETQSQLQVLSHRPSLLSARLCPNLSSACAALSLKSQLSAPLYPRTIAFAADGRGRSTTPTHLRANPEEHDVTQTVATGFPWLEDGRKCSRTIRSLSLLLFIFLRSEIIDPPNRFIPRGSDDQLYSPKREEAMPDDSFPFSASLPPDSH